MRLLFFYLRVVVDVFRRGGLPNVWEYASGFLMQALATKITIWTSGSKFVSLYGFDLKENWKKYSLVGGIGNDTNMISGGLVQMSKMLSGKLNRVLLVGENNESKRSFGAVLGVKENRIVTAGLGAGVDVRWDFEESPKRGLGKFDLVVSQSMLEHLVDPYKHIRDLVALTNFGGYLFVDTVIPGMGYHRFPIDCFRFFPDWFEEVAVRFDLEVISKNISYANIFYLFRKKRPFLTN